eukprot:m51a1_g5740 hypothetical protein (312) ;mRNA; r:1162401-1163336
MAELLQLCPGLTRVEFNTIYAEAHFSITPPIAREIACCTTLRELCLKGEGTYVLTEDSRAVLEGSSVRLEKLSVGRVEGFDLLLSLPMCSELQHFDARYYCAVQGSHLQALARTCAGTLRSISLNLRGVARSAEQEAVLFSSLNYLIRTCSSRLRSVCIWGCTVADLVQCMSFDVFNARSEWEDRRFCSLSVFLDSVRDISEGEYLSLMNSQCFIQKLGMDLGPDTPLPTRLMRALGRSDLVRTLTLFCEDENLDRVLGLDLCRQLPPSLSKLKLMCKCDDLLKHKALRIVAGALHIYHRSLRLKVLQQFN